MLHQTFSRCRTSAHLAYPDRIEAFVGALGGGLSTRPRLSHCRQVPSECSAWGHVPYYHSAVGGDR